MRKVYVVDLRVERGPAKYRPDSRVPFDRFYLVPPEGLKHLTQIAPYAIALPLHKGYEESLKQARVGESYEELVKQKYSVVLPVHMSTVKKESETSNELYPRFTVRSEWWGEPGLEKFIPDTVTLHTPNGELAPMCAYCARSLEHLSGECRLGTADCAAGFRLTYKPLHPDKYKDLVQLEPLPKPVPRFRRR